MKTHEDNKKDVTIGRTKQIEIMLLTCLICIATNEVQASGKVDYVDVSHPKTLGVDQLKVERIPLGQVGDYKPCMIKLDNGELLLTAFSGAGSVSDEYVFFYRSRDGGKTWSDREYRDLLGREPYLSRISDGTIFISTHVLGSARGNVEHYVYSYLYRSTDHGRTWQWDKTAIDDRLLSARKNDTRPETAPVVTSRNVLELSDGSLIFAVGSQFGSEFLWRSNDKGKTWDKSLPSEFDALDIATYQWSVQQEAILWQAPSGDLLSVCRISPKFYPMIEGIDRPRTSVDHYERLVLYRSKDGGRKWFYEEIGSYYGEMYPSILRLTDGRLLCTFTMRAAVAPQEAPLGVHAVLGEETQDSFKFDFEHDRIRLDTKTPVGLHSGGGFGPTVQLDDGTLVTCVSYRRPDNKTEIEVIRWRLPPK